MGHRLSVTCGSEFPVGFSCWSETSAVKADTHQQGWESCFFASILWIKFFCLQSGKRHRARQCHELLLGVVQCNPCTQRSFPLPVLEGPLLLQGSETVFLCKLQDIWSPPFCCHLRNIFSIIFSTLTSLLSLSTTYHLAHPPEDKKIPVKLGTLISPFLIVSGLIMNFESLPNGYLFPWKKNAHL